MPAIAADIPTSALSNASESDSYASITSIHISHRETEVIVVDTNQQASETQSDDYTPMEAREMSTPGTYKRLQRLALSKKDPAEDPATLKEIHEYVNPISSSHCYYNIKWTTDLDIMHVLLYLTSRSISRLTQKFKKKTT